MKKVQRKSNAQIQQRMTNIIKGQWSAEEDRYIPNCLSLSTLLIIFLCLLLNSLQFHMRLLMKIFLIDLGPVFSEVCQCFFVPYSSAWTNGERFMWFCSVLVQLVKRFGIKKWSHIARLLNGRVGKQCRERWHNHLRPNIRVTLFTFSLSLSLLHIHS